MARHARMWVRSSRRARKEAPEVQRCMICSFRCPPVTRLRRACRKLKLHRFKITKSSHPFSRFPNADEIKTTYLKTWHQVHSARRTKAGDLKVIVKCVARWRQGGWSEQHGRPSSHFDQRRARSRFIGGAMHATHKMTDELALREQRGLGKRGGRR